MARIPGVSPRRPHGTAGPAGIRTRLADADRRGRAWRRGRGGPNEGWVDKGPEEMRNVRAPMAGEDLAARRPAARRHDLVASRMGPGEARARWPGMEGGEPGPSPGHCAAGKGDRRIIRVACLPACLQAPSEGRGLHSDPVAHFE